MNRRSFLSILGLGPVVASVAPAAKAYATGGYILPEQHVIGEMAGETVLPTYPNGIPQVSVDVEVWPHDGVSYDTAVRGFSREEVRKWAGPLQQVPDMDAKWPEW